MPEKPELYGVYRGRVSNVLEFGCFVELQGFRMKAEGLVHTSNIAKQRWSRPLDSLMVHLSGGASPWKSILSIVS